MSSVAPAFLPAFAASAPLRRARAPLRLGRAAASVARRAPRPRPRTRAHPSGPTCTRKADVAAAAAAAITVGLSWLPLRAPVPHPAMADSATRPPDQSLVFHHPAHSASAEASAPTSVAVVGVAKAPIHDYHFSHAEAPVVPTQPDADRHLVQEASMLDAAAEDARREFVLAARLVTAVLLGVMVGIERRATALNMGVRSVTIATLSAALLSVVTTCSQATGVILWPAVAAAPMMPVLGAGAASGLALYIAAKARPRRPREMMPMCVVVGLVVAMGGACGAGLSLVTAACYLGAISVMRGSETSRTGMLGSDTETLGEDSDFGISTEELWDDEDQMVVRIRRGKNGTRTRVMEVRGSVLDPRLDPEHSDFAL